MTYFTELAKNHPALMNQLIHAGFKARTCRDAQVYCRIATVLHEGHKLVKHVVTHKDGVALKYEIVAVVVDLTALGVDEGVGVNFVVEYNYGNANHCMLEKMVTGSKFDLAAIEQLFHRVFQAV